MINADDLTYSEVRHIYVVPLINEFVQKAGIANHVNELLPSSNSDPPIMMTGTLYDDIVEDGDDADGRCYRQVSSLYSYFNVHMTLF